MIPIFRTKEFKPIVFNEEEHKDKDFIIFPGVMFYHAPSIKNFMESYYKKVVEVDIHKFTFKGFYIIIGKGFIYFYSYYRTEMFYIIICEDKYKEFYAFYNITKDTESLVKRIANKVIKEFKIENKNIITLSKEDMVNNFIMPVKPGISSLNEETQKEISNEFLLTEKQLLNE